MKTPDRNALVVKDQFGVSLNADLARKFQQARQRKDNIEDFVNEFMVQFLSEDTKIAYLKDLKLFFDFLKSGMVSITHPSQIEAYHFQLYRDEMLNRGLSSATINRRLVVIRSFIKWSIAKGMMDRNPLDTVKLPKVQTVSPTVAFDDEEVKAMLNAPDLSEYRGRMHRIVMVLLFQLGLRRSELINLKLENIVEERGHRVLRVKGKGDKLRLMPLSPFVLRELDDYFSTFKAIGRTLAPGDFLIQTDLFRKNWTPIDGSTIYRVVNRYAKALGINKRVSPHSCRATVISHLLDTQERPIREVAEFAGHSNVTTTERYDKRRGNLDKNAAYCVDYGIDFESDDESAVG